MTIDQEDYAPRPADDCVAFYPSISFFQRQNSDRPRFKSLLNGMYGFYTTLSAPHCHQLGCNFSELPHG